MGDFLMKKAVIITSIVVILALAVFAVLFFMFNGKNDTERLNTIKLIKNYIAREEFERA